MRNKFYEIIIHLELRNIRTINNNNYNNNNNKYLNIQNLFTYSYSGVKTEQDHQISLKSDNI